ncbi:MAG: hypothetical protein OXF02_05535 [Simkaniaceae bacterium]|nr:hypothetical protein [Simkaniaceae bacterium]
MTSCREVMDELRAIEKLVGTMEADGPTPATTDALDRLVNRIDTVRKQISSEISRSHGWGYLHRACMIGIISAHVLQVVGLIKIFYLGGTDLRPVAFAGYSSLTAIPLIMMTRDLENTNRRQWQEWKVASEFAGDLQTRAERMRPTRTHGAVAEHGADILGARGAMVESRTHTDRFPIGSSPRRRFPEVRLVNPDRSGQP